MQDMRWQHWVLFKKRAKENLAEVVQFRGCLPKLDHTSATCDMVRFNDLFNIVDESHEG